MKVSSLHIYPVKSCYRTDLQNVTIGETGFENDRRWMIVDENGQFLTQRQLPRMALVRPDVSANSLQLHLGEENTLKLPLYTEEFAQRTVRVWQSDCTAQDYGDDAAQSLSDFLQTSCRLVTMN